MTQRAALVGIIGCCFYVITLLNGLPEYFSILTWLSVSVLVCSAGVALLSLQGLHCEWKIVTAIAAERIDQPGSAAESTSDDLTLDELSGPSIEMSLSNGGTLSKVNLLLDVRLRNVRSGARTTRRFHIEALPAGAAITSTLTLLELPRGRYDIVELRVIGSDVLGLFRATMRVRLVQKEQGSAHHDRPVTERQVIIGPASIVGPRAPALSGIVDAGGDATAINRLGRGEEIRGTRPYVAGDGLRTVHWKSTARLGRLVVKEFHPLVRSEAVVIRDGVDSANDIDSGTADALDVSRTRDDSSVSRPYGATEHALVLTMSLCRTLAERGRPCTLLRLDSHPACISSLSRGATEYSMAAYSGGEEAAVSSGQNAFLLRCSEALADAAPDRKTGLAAALGAQLAHVDAGGDVYLVTASLSPDTGHAATLLKRRGSRLAVALVESSEATKGQRDNDEQRQRSAPKASFQAETSVNYREQARRLAAAGARVVIVRPGADVAPNLSTALSRLLDERFAAGAAGIDGESQDAVNEPSPISENGRHVAADFDGVGSTATQHNHRAIK